MPVTSLHHEGTENTEGHGGFRFVGLQWVHMTKIQAWPVIGQAVQADSSLKYKKLRGSP
ncbi:MAG: hypothetical protein IPK82_13590 [Polyangiaceae bacterium]|nr:hypothetical protein [Polyangiaceae bacterium]